MNILLIILSVILIFVVNPVIAYWNAKTAGNIWNTVSTASTWEKLLVISALVQSVVGFSMPSLGVLLFLGYMFKLLTMNQIYLGVDLMWISVIVPLVGTGLIITVQSVKDAIKERSLASGGVALWNVGASIENIIDMVSNFGSVIKDISKRSDDEDDSQNIVIVGIVVLSLCMGALFTALAFNHGRKESSLQTTF